MKLLILITSSLLISSTSFAQLLPWVPWTYLNNLTDEHEVSENEVRALVKFKKGDIKCVEKHKGGFGQHIPGRIFFEPEKGNNDWGSEDINDYDQRITRIRLFQKILEDTETCDDFKDDFPTSNQYVDFIRTVKGNSGTAYVISNKENQVGQIVETVTMPISPKLVLTGTNQWIDWSVDINQFDASKKFYQQISDDFKEVESQIYLQTDAQSGLACKTVNNQMSLTFSSGSSPTNNAVELSRIYPNEETCIDALTQLSQKVAARGRTWLDFNITATRSLYTTTRVAVWDCDRIRVEQIEAEIEGIKFYGTNFIPLQTYKNPACGI